MSNDELTLFEPTPVPHPGDTILEYLEFHGWSQRDLSRRSGITPKTISEICNGKASITSTTALALEKVFQRPAHLWMNLQSRYDEAEARLRQKSKSKEWIDWARAFPLKEMKSLRFSLPEGSSDADALLQFFGVASPDSWRTVWNTSPVAYRQTRRSAPREEAVTAWVRQVELVASGLQLAEFDEQQLRSSLEPLRRLTQERTSEILGPLQGICAKAGVAVVLVPALKNTGISGCVRWLNNKRAVIGLTLRYKTDDQLWFSIFHELGHVLLHRHRFAFIVDNAADDLGDRVVDPEMEKYEEEANRFAADTLIPPTALGEFVRAGDYSSEAIYGFSQMIGIGPGIVVGRLQHDAVLKHYQGRSFKQVLGWGFSDEEQ